MKRENEKPVDDKAKEDSGGVAESILDGLGNLVPGLGGLIKGLKKSDAFRDRLDSINEEVELRLKETPVDVPDSFARHRSRPPSGIPPLVARRGTTRKKHFHTFTGGYDPMDKGERDVPVDIFEEEKKMRVIVELPGVNEEDIRLDLNEDTLTISASHGNRNYYKDVRLPRVSEGVIGKIYNNGILEVTLS